MVPRRLSVLLVWLCLAGTGWAAPGVHYVYGGKQLLIVEVSGTAITVEAGRETEVTFLLTERTKILLDGFPVSANDVKPGMVAAVKVDSEEKTVVALHLHHPPRPTRKPPL
jgi:hypothetical protein